MTCPLTNTEVLFFVLGYQGGTLHQLAAELGVSKSDILGADTERMGELCRLAQRKRYHREQESSKILQKLREKKPC